MVRRDQLSVASFTYPSKSQCRDWVASIAISGEPRRARCVMASPTGLASAGPLIYADLGKWARLARICDFIVVSRCDLVSSDPPDSP